jgi:MYXO-CTERM domain-containing protein
MLTMVATVGGLAIAGAATATGVNADLNGEDLDLQGGSFPTLFDNGNHAFAGSDLRDVHADLNADGVATRRRVTFLVADTAEGMSIMALVDSSWDSSNNTLWNLGLQTSAPSGKGYRINDIGSDEMSMTDGPTGSEADVEFQWRAGRADGYSWTHLEFGDSVTFDLDWAGGAGLRANNAIRFVTYTEDGWAEADRANFDENGAFSVTFDAIPAPGALALLGLAGLISRRRRR